MSKTTKNVALGPPQAEKILRDIPLLVLTHPLPGVGGPLESSGHKAFAREICGPKPLWYKGDFLRR